MDDKGVSRRRLLTAGALAGALPMAPATAAVIRGDTPWQPGAAAAPPSAEGGQSYGYFTPAEAAFIEAAVGRLIPADALGPGALEAGVPLFIDRQLAGEFGRGAHWYMQGPWGKGAPTQGYQTRLTPAQMYRAAIRDIDAEAGRQANGATFAKLKPDDQDAFLKTMEGGQLQLQSVDGKGFFDMLLQNTIEGFFSDPIYGGNRNMVGWKLIGFPGARYDHSPYVARHGEKYPLPPVGLTGRPDWARR